MHIDDKRKIILELVMSINKGSVLKGHVKLGDLAEDTVQLAFDQFDQIEEELESEYKKR